MNSSALLPSLYFFSVYTFTRLFLICIADCLNKRKQTKSVNVGREITKRLSNSLNLSNRKLATQV